MYFADKRILWPLRQIIHEFAYSLSTLKFRLNDLFGNLEVPMRLSILSLKHMENVRVLARYNFTTITVLKEFIMENSDVEIIKENTFDKLVYLRLVSFKDNQLKTLPATLLHVIIEIDIFDVFTMKDKRVAISGHDLACTCDVHELFGAMNIFYIPSKTKLQTTLRCNQDLDESIPIESIDSTCPRLQIIQSRPECFLSNQTKAFAYRKFSIKFDAKLAQLRISTFGKDQYRLWIRNSNFDHPQEYLVSRKCLRREYIETAVKCFQIENETIVIPIGHHLRMAEMTTICLNFIAKNRYLSAWPLHCISIRWKEENPIWQFIFSQASLSIFIGLCVCIGFGIVLIGLFVYFYRRVETEENQ